MNYSLNSGLWYYIVHVLNNDQMLPWQLVLLTSGFALIALAAGYFLGSINSAIFISRLIYKDDIRNHGSGNAGLTNMLRTYGKSAAGLTLLGDLLKTALSVVIGCILGGFGYIGAISVGNAYCMLPLGYIAGFAAIIGHILPIYYNFKGGKGVLCTAVMALVLTPIEFAILIGVFVLIVATTKYVSLGSVTAAILYPVAVNAHMQIAFGKGSLDGMTAFITIIIAIIIVYCHRENLKRISEGTERKLSIGGKKKKDSEASDEASEK